ncbi:hypothetical protein B0H13DRAFT_1892398 [Mycena leptocephala]|nr:hypothetical protein B0H13DRAFT_1892398 [Mycena leptocephala]
MALDDTALVMDLGQRSRLGVADLSRVESSRSCSSARKRDWERDLGMIKICDMGVTITFDLSRLGRVDFQIKSTQQVATRLSESRQHYTGANQAGMKWLKTAGISLPDNLRCSYNPNVRYATLCFSVSAELESSLPIPEHAINTMCGYTFVEHFTYGLSTAGFAKTDNNTIQVLVTSSGDNLPRSISEVVPFLSAVGGHEPIPSWFLRTVEILSDQSYVKYHTIPAGTLRPNFIAIGDANIQLNPIHGQGFAKVILNAITLNSLLHSIDSPEPTLPRDFSAHYFRKNAARTEGLWDATRLHDYRASSCEPMAGETRDTGRFARWFELKLISAATQYEGVASALWHVRHLIAADRALLAPTVLWKVLWTSSRF